MSKNDEKVLQLKKTIEEKKSKLATTNKFYPVTNCVLDLEGNKFNLNVLDRNGLELLLVRLNMYKMSADELKMELKLCGYLVTEWMDDIAGKLTILDEKKERDTLKALESKLDKMLSDEKKTELELEEIAKILG